ncbi:hypothetical protein [Flavipsychrobacter stenotrophus]|uniref:hypothetical protein n=1 Tax=Flavipsychrobacter stenotrophus TaxID=2077091 RepID=UPI001056E458|nr:hypothetical protein [Flavipsychrobacter stenotrophus]
MIKIQTNAESNTGFAILKGRIVQLHNYFTAIPRHVHQDNYWFYNISNLAYTLIMLLHCSWIIVFRVLDISPMVNLQFPSIATYIVAIALNRRGFHLVAMFLCLLEINLHQLTAVILLGWSSGFQNFIPLIALMPFLKYNEAWYTKTLLCLLSFLFYLYIDFYIRNSAPTYILDQGPAVFLNISNVVLSFILVSLWGIVLSISYQRTVTALILKEQELFTAQKMTEQAEILRQLEVKERDNEIYQLRNVELKNSNDEILAQKVVIEKLVAEQEQIILARTGELAETNAKLINANKQLMALIQFNAHSIREPLCRILGAMTISEYMTQEEFYIEIWPQVNKATTDLDIAVKQVIKYADEAIEENG